MATTTERIARTETTSRVPAPKRSRRREWFLPTYTGLVIGYLFLPILVMIMFGFNDPPGRYNFQWSGFTLKWYNPQRLLEFEELNIAVRNSLVIGIAAMIVATALGTLIALALTRHRFRGRSGLNLGLFLPMASPEVVLGVSLLSLFVTLQIVRGLVTIFIAHVMFCISYVVVTVKARTSNFDSNYEDAAQDLGADPWTTFWTVTFPLIFPGILAAALLSFALSIDDFVITSFNAGATSTIPLWVYGASRIGVPPQVNVMGTLLFMIGVIYVVVSLVRTSIRTDSVPAVAPKG
jgi:spermidine/putrescine transport system permease protein